MANKYRKSSTELFSFRLMQQVNKMRSELHEHRYYLERNVAQRTEHLTRRIDVLEACNAALCSKLVSSQKSLEKKYPESSDSASKIRLVNAPLCKADHQLRNAS